MRRRPGPSLPGKPPHAHGSAGLKEINFDVRESSAIIGPRKFPRSNFFTKPVPALHEKGGVGISTRLRKRKDAYYPERSFMYSAVKKLKQKGKIEQRFNVTLRNNL